MGVDVPMYIIESAESETVTAGPKIAYLNSIIKILLILYEKY